MITAIYNMIMRANSRENRKKAIEKELLSKNPSKHIVVCGSEYATLRSVPVGAWNSDYFDDIFDPAYGIVVCDETNRVKFYEFTPELDPMIEDVAQQLKVIR